jgi:D-alanyl-D-alanine carboxypeptidase
MDASLCDRLKRALKQTLASAEIPGATLAVRIDGQPLLQMAEGYQDRDQSQPLTVDAQFYIYSITKTLIAAAVLHQVRAGRLDLEAVLQDYWPSYPVPTPVTLRQILSHTSGLPDYGGLADYHAAVKTTPGQPWSTEQFLTVVRQRGLLLAPGTHWAYSNLGYLSLKLLLEQTTGQSLQGILAELFFEPLGLRQTFVATTLSEVTSLTPGYTQALGGDGWQDMAQRYHPGWVSHGVVVSTAAELAQLIEALMVGQILEPPLVEQMACPVHSLGPYPPLANVGCGLGLFLDTASPYGRVAGHNGGGPGYSTAAFYFSALAGRPTAIAAMTNQECDHVATALVFAAARVLAGG